MKYLYGKTVLISGVSSGFGKEFAKALIDGYGCKVYGIARNEGKVEKFKSELGEKSKNFIDCYYFDVSNEENWKKLSEKLLSLNVTIDVVINCAGYLPPFKKFGYYETEEFKRIFDVDFFSCVYSVKYLMPIIENSVAPAFINVSSSSALMTFGGISGYSAAKSALKSFTLSLAEEYRGKIYFACICPGFTKTDIFSSMDMSEKELKLVGKFSSDCEKTVKKCIRRINSKKILTVVCFDAKLMSFSYKIAPVLTARLTTKILRKSKLKTFEKI